MGPKSRRKPLARDKTQRSPEMQNSSLSNATSDSASGDASQSTAVIKLRPLSSLISENSRDIAQQFAFGENSISTPSTQLVDNSRPEDPLLVPSGSESKPTPRKAKAGRPKKEKTVDDKGFVTPTKPSRGRFKTKLTGNYHKVTDFFPITPRRNPNPEHGDKENIQLVSATVSTTTAAGEDKGAITNKLTVPSVISKTIAVVTRTQQEKPVAELPQYNDSKSIRPVTKIEVRRKICKSTDLRKISNRYHTRDQKRMERFFDSTGGGEGCSYFATYPESHFPVEISGEFDVDKVLSCLKDHEEIAKLDIQVAEESGQILIDLNGEEELESVPQKKLLECIEKELAKLVDNNNNISTNRESEGDVQIIEQMEEVISIGSSVSDKEDGEYVPEKVEVKPKRRGKKAATGKVKKKEVKPKVTPKKKGIKQKPICPSYKIVKGTKFAVDAFRFGEIELVTHYFLTHFHSDHYIGLTKKFEHPLFMSKVTANLVRKILKVNEQYINTMELGSPIMVDNVEVTALDANHCPGAVMFVFKLPTGECILHVGDFRASPDMEMEPIFWNNHMNCIYLDTTYLTSKHEHPTQSDSITSMINFVDTYREQNIGVKYVIIVGTYVIGKEKVWSGLARHLGCRVWLEKSRQEAVECYEDASLLELLEVDPTKALVHVLPLQNLFYDNLVY